MTVQTIRRSSIHISLEELEDRAAPSSVSGLTSPLFGLDDLLPGPTSFSLSERERVLSASQGASFISPELSLQPVPLVPSNGGQESAKPDAGQIPPAGGKLTPAAVVAPTQTELVEVVINGGGGTIQGPDDSPQITDFWGGQSGSSYVFHGVVTGNVSMLVGQLVYFSNLPTLDGPPQATTGIVLDGATMSFTYGVTLTSADVGIAHAITQDTSGRWSNTAQTAV